MPKVRVHNLAVSLDGYMAGPDQSLDNPLGVGGTRLHEWVFETRGGRQMMGEEGGTEGIDNDFWARGDVGIGATIMGRNMFGPIRGPWGDEQWKGWWGDEPPYHHPVFVLTHHPRPPIQMQGGTTFHFVDPAGDRGRRGQRRQDRRRRRHHPAVPPRRPDRRDARGDRAHPPGRRRAALRQSRRRPGGLRVRRARQLARGRARPPRPNVDLGRPAPRHVSWKPPSMVRTSPVV